MVRDAAQPIFEHFSQATLPRLAQSDIDALIATHAANPFGPHPDELARVLNVFRAQGTRGKDVVSATTLISAARRAGVDNIIYVSIVGIDRIPMGYYKSKLRVEEALAASGLGHTIIRVTQFHNLIETMFSVQRFSPALFTIKRARFQPIDTRDVATHLVSLIDEGPQGRVEDIGGPAVYDHDELGRMYLASLNSRRRVLSLPVPGGIAAGLKSGANLVPANPIGKIGFAEYLSRTQ